MSGTVLTEAVIVHLAAFLEIISPISRERKLIGSLPFVFSFSCFQKGSFWFLTGLHVFRKVLIVTISIHFVSFVLVSRISLVAQPGLPLAV